MTPRQRRRPAARPPARLRTIGVIRSALAARSAAPKQGHEGAPDAWLEVHAWAAPALEGLAAGDELIVITWLHRGRRDVLRVHPRSDPRRPLTGVFATRSPDRPNPLGLHPVTVRAIDGHRLRIGPIEAIDGTPVVDVKPALRAVKPRTRAASEAAPARAGEGGPGGHARSRNRAGSARARDRHRSPQKW